MIKLPDISRIKILIFSGIISYSKMLISSYPESDPNRRQKVHINTLQSRFRGLLLMHYFLSNKCPTTKNWDFPNFHFLRFGFYYFETSQRPNRWSNLVVQSIRRCIKVIRRIPESSLTGPKPLAIQPNFLNHPQKNCHPLHLTNCPKIKKRF